MHSKALALLDSTGYVGDGKRNAAETPETYFNTLYEAFEAWYYHLACLADHKGYGVPELPMSEVPLEAMYAGQNQQRFIPLINGKGKHGIYISIYKRDEGVRVYEATAYIS